MKKHIFLLIVCLMLLLTGCAGKETGTVYKYDEPEVVKGFILSKAVYNDNKLTIYHKGTLNDSYNVHTLGDTDCSINDKYVEIISKDGEDITSLAFDNGNNRYEVRYLNTNQYAVLAYSWAEDLGWDRIGGDVNLYYTEEELAEQKRRKEEKQALFDANWALVEGYYEAEDGDFIEFSVNESGTRIMVQGKHGYPVYNIIVNGTSVAAECMDDPLSYRFEFELSEDGTYIVARDYSIKEDKIYSRR